MYENLIRAGAQVHVVDIEAVCVGDVDSWRGMGETGISAVKTKMDLGAANHKTGTGNGAVKVLVGKRSAGP